MSKDRSSKAIKWAFDLGAGKIGRRSLSRTEKEGAWTRVALKKGHILEGYRNAGGFFGRGPKAGGFESRWQATENPWGSIKA